MGNLRCYHPLPLLANGRVPADRLESLHAPLRCESKHAQKFFLNLQNSIRVAQFANLSMLLILRYY